MDRQPMFYWGQGNFTGLLSVADALANEPEFGRFADYCCLREKGVRAKAFEALDGFIQTTLVRSEQQQRKMIERLLSLRYENPRVHQLLPDPLFKRLIYPVLEAWRQAEPQNVVPLRWLGLCRRDLELFQEVLRIDPEDQISCWELALSHLRGAQWATHHISESVLLSDEAHVLECLAQMEAFIPRIRDAAQRQQLTDLHAHESELIRDWSDFVKSGEKDFPAWCRRHGKAYSWSKAYYYGS